MAGPMPSMTVRSFSRTGMPSTRAASARSGSGGAAATTCESTTACRSRLRASLFHSRTRSSLTQCFCSASWSGQVVAFGERRQVGRAACGTGMPSGVGSVGGASMRCACSSSTTRCRFRFARLELGDAAAQLIGLGAGARSPRRRRPRLVRPMDAQQPPHDATDERGNHQPQRPGAQGVQHVVSSVRSVRRGHAEDHSAALVGNLGTILVADQLGFTKSLRRDLGGGHAELHQRVGARPWRAAR